jgi:transcription elongation factor
MPAQSGSSSVLQRMKRGYNRASYDQLVQRARQLVPGVALSTDIITGEQPTAAGAAAVAAAATAAAAAAVL